MKKTLLVCALGAAFALAPLAHADTFSLSFGGYFSDGTAFSTGSNGSGTDVSFSVAGTPTPGAFLNPNTYAISDLQGTVVIGGTTYTIGKLDNGLGGNNQLADNWFGLLSPDGFDFDLSTTGSPTDVYSQLLIEYNYAAGEFTGQVCNHSGCTQVTDATISGLDIYDVSNAPATPEPGSLALLGTSILGGAGLLRRRFRHN